jgi:phage gp29-like protein
MYFYWLLKSELLRRASEAAARYAKGVIGFGLDTLRPASDDRTNDEIVQKVIEVVDAMLTRGVIVHGKEDEVSFHEPAAQGAQFILTMIEYIDQTLTRLAFGSVLPAGISEGTGSLARAEVEFDVSESVIQYDRDILDETITRDLIGLFWRLNRANFVALGLGEAQPPRFRSHRRKSHDPKEMISVIQAALASGIPLRKDEVYRVLGFTPPKPDEDVIVGGIRGPAEGAFASFPAIGFVAPISTPANPAGPRLHSSPDGNGAGT